MTFLLGVWYIRFSYLFLYIEKLKIVWSIVIFFVLIFGCETIGILLTMRHYKNNFFVGLNSIIPFGIYTMLSRYEAIKREIIIMLTVIAILSAMFASYILEERPENKKDYIMFRHYQWECVLVVSWSLLAEGFLALMIGYAYDSWLEALHILLGSI